MLKTFGVPKIYISDEVIFEDEYVCEDCKSKIEEPRRLTRGEFEPSVDYKCTQCGKMIYEPKEKF